MKRLCGLFDENEANGADEVLSPMTGNQPNNLQKRINNILKNLQESREMQANGGHPKWINVIQYVAIEHQEGKTFLN